ncbi:putative phosphoribosyl transferase [Parasphingorhabdus marina DSM 22363]|uniref:Putative phosphoribosyl transferase n=1 Tax=Parasphingorhabdus marina DSM 22363 TaxID=1123272 RepID=A0A1N6CQ91_9SPHN|nr:phosphoribosyltransferase [Parasphingorhabdus marina]SIN60738.1 putative phosphoribosyl transferase [Parasphingorhabdus marina DSM 22363]
MKGPAPFSSRRDAGRKLAARFVGKNSGEPVILALPRGGVPVAYEVAKALHAPLDLLMVRKIGAEGWQEYGLGAVIDGDGPHLVLNEGIVRELAPNPNYIRAEMRRQLKEIKRRRLIYLGERKPLGLTDRNIIVVDDGIATGGTMRAALECVRKQGPRHITMAVPVAPPSTLNELAVLCDDMICLVSPANFGAVGNFYRDFRQTADSEIIRLMAELEQETASET